VSRKPRLGALPDGAYLSIIGPTATQGRRYVAFIMDTPSEYTSRTRSIGFGEHPMDAAAAAIDALPDYPVQEWPYLNEAILRAERVAAGWKP
jgi:hypothetical protein